MAVYSPEALGIKPPPGGFTQGGWFQGRQYWGGTLSDPGVIHPSSNQIGAGQAVSAEVNRQSAALQGVSPQQFEGYLQQQRQAGVGVQPTAQAVAPSGPSTPSGPSGPSGPGVAFQAPEAINLPNIYQGLYASSGIADIEGQLTQQAQAYSVQVSKIKDNPYLSEATMTGRLKKLDEKFNRDTAILRDQIATKKADVETQLNLQLKQFDINSQQTKLAWDQFNTLLTAGALTGASGEDIANITRSTGISSNMIYSAINAQKQKNVETQVISSTDDAGVVTATIINSKTGEVIAKQNLGAIGKAETGGVGSAAKTIKAQFVEEAGSLGGQTINGIWWGIFPQLVAKYAPYMSLEDIYNLYTTSGAGKTYGAPAESGKEIKQLYDYSREGKEPED